ncbi:hypothetical protein OROMI_018681 [Orobanche minor]
MNTHRSWMNLPRLMDAYKQGVQYFWSFAFSNSNDVLILCPCKGCKNGIFREWKIVESHIITKGFLKGYTKWVFHGESFSNMVPLVNACSGGVGMSDNMHELIYDQFPMFGEDNDIGDERPSEEAEKFYRLLNDAE